VSRVVLRRTVVVVAFGSAACNLVTGASDLVTVEDDPVDAGPRADAAPPLEASLPPPSSTGDSGGADTSFVDVVDSARPRPDGGKLVFVSSTLTTGNMNGLVLADKTCNDLATAAGLGGKWSAWLSIDGEDEMRTRAIDRVTAGTEYYLVDGTRVVTQRQQLASNNLEHAIDKDESGTLRSPAPVWTGTRNGAYYFGDCSGWTSANQNVLGTTGTTAARGLDWSTAEPNGCAALQRLYCFEN